MSLSRDDLYCSVGNPHFDRYASGINRYAAREWRSFSIVGSP
jgi:hypothetical protein